MKLQLNHSPATRGSVLMVSLLTAFIIGLTLASYLILVQAENRSVARSQNWNHTMVVTEAGVEDALQLINKYVETPDLLPAWPTTAAADGWTHVGNVYYVRRYLDVPRNIYYDAYVTNFTNGPAIYCVGHVPSPNLYSQALPQGFVAAAGVTLNAAVGGERKVFVKTMKDPLFNVAMAALGRIDMKGNNVATDSYDSSDSNYSTDGRYDPAKRKDGGDVVTNGSITNSGIGVGNANVMGHVKTGPTGDISIGPRGSVGSVSWVAGGNSGIQEGWFANDFNVQFNDVVLPNLPWLAAPTGGKVDGTSYDYVFPSGTSGNYLITESGSIYVGTNATVALNVTADTFSPPSIYIAGGNSDSGKLVVYMQGEKLSLSGNDIVQSQNAANLSFYGLPTCTTINFNGNGAFYGVIYAPEADYTLTGSGSSTAVDITGATVTRTVTLNGHFNFHYDENLRNVGPSRGYIPSSWAEVH
ncbi:MAG: hypothetical protein P8Z30_20010 [Acidobacteriota bacterium]